MKKTRHISVVAIVAALCLASGGMKLRGQSAPNAPTQPEIPQQTETTTAPGQPTRLNKCRQLIGTSVENPQGDKLGKIDDVVIDFNTGQVAYCVLSVDHGALATAKCLALPLAALQPSADGSRLILNADKDKVAEAQGLDRDHWPSLTNPAWGAQPFWRTAPAATATAPSSHELPRQ
jgi:sporulation protein YlmC with PRC-barrel domain